MTQNIDKNNQLTINRNYSELEITKHNETGLYVIKKYGISAGALELNGIPIAIQGDGKLYCSPKRIIHKPDTFKNGLLKLENE